MARTRRNNPQLVVIPGGKDTPPISLHPKGEAPPYKPGDVIKSVNGIVTGCRWVRVPAMEWDNSSNRFVPVMKSDDSGELVPVIANEYWQVICDREDEYLRSQGWEKNWCYNADFLK